MAEINQAAEDLFYKLRNRFPKISMGDENGTKTIDPEQARFFNFNYTDKKSNRDYGAITCSIISGDALKVIFDSAITERMLPEDANFWYSFLRELRRLAKRHMLNFDVRDITKDYLSKQDYDFMKMQNPEKKKMKESLEESRVLWQRKGKVSEGNLNNVRIHVVHNERMLENPHNRLLKVDRIFLVNESGEKFLLPFKSVSGAKAMANHVSRGGNPYDVQGQLIGRAVNEMRNLGRFIRSTNNKTFEAAEAGNVITSAVQMRESIKRHLNRLSNNSRNFNESLTELANLISESPEDITEVKGWFTQQTYNENLDNYLASAAGAYKKLKESAMGKLAEAAGAVEQKILDPNFKLVLKADSAMDKLMISRDYRDTIAMLGAILGDIANRLVSKDGDDVANFASLMGDLISSEGEAFGTKPDDEYARDKKLAIMLAQKYMKDLHQVIKNPEYASQVRIDNKKREESVELRTEADEFSDSIMGIGEEKVEETDEQPGWLKPAEVEEAEIPLPPERPAALGGKHPMPPTRSQDEPMHDVNLGKLPKQNTQVAEPTGKSATPSFDDLAGDLWNAVKTDVKDMWTGQKTPPNTLPPGNYPGNYIEDDVNEEDMEEGNEFSGALAKARASNADSFEVDGKTYQVKEDEVSEDDVEEGNEFSGALAKAKASGADSFEVGGKTYQVRESSINDIRKLAGLELLSEYTVTEAPPKANVSKAQLDQFRKEVGNQNATLGQYLNAQQGLTARKGGANDPAVIQQNLAKGMGPGSITAPKAYDPNAPKGPLQGPNSRLASPNPSATPVNTQPSPTGIGQPSFNTNKPETGGDAPTIAPGSASFNTNKPETGGAAPAVPPTPAPPAPPALATMGGSGTPAAKNAGKTSFAVGGARLPDEPKQDSIPPELITPKSTGPAQTFSKDGISGPKAGQFDNWSNESINRLSRLAGIK